MSNRSMRSSLGRTGIRRVARPIYVRSRYICMYVTRVGEEVSGFVELAERCRRAATTSSTHTSCTVAMLSVPHTALTLTLRLGHPLLSTGTCNHCSRSRRRRSSWLVQHLTSMRAHMVSVQYATLVTYMHAYLSIDGQLPVVVDPRRLGALTWGACGKECPGAQRTCNVTF